MTEGQVELVENVYHDSQLIAASESATATTAGKIARDSVRFPSSPRGLIYVFSGQERPTLVHGGPGRAGGGVELGGTRGLELYTQRTAIQGDRALLGRILGIERA